ncbi:MAG: hypothetical protein BWY56_02361 [Acidobacteria bacterium ADurb.Bin340]|nr:MAG: hypothetical protein BWY56_02361 [Acidobacteria bacterium ADurb.Bin340]
MGDALLPTAIQDAGAGGHIPEGDHGLHLAVIRSGHRQGFTGEQSFRDAADGLGITTLQKGVPCAIAVLDPLLDALAQQGLGQGEGEQSRENEPHYWASGGVTFTPVSDSIMRTTLTFLGSRTFSRYR